MLSFYLAAFLGALCVGIFSVALPLYLIDKFQITSFFLGLFAAIWAFLYAIIAIIAGNLCNTISQKKLILMNCILIAIIYFFIIMAKSLNQIFLLGCFSAISWGIFWTPLLSWLSHKVEPKKLTKTIGIYNISWCSALAIGSFINGFFYKIYNWLPFVVISILSIINMIVISKEPCLKHHYQNYQIEKKSINNKKNIWDVDNLFLYLVWILNFIGAMIICHFPKLAYSLNIDVIAISTIISFISLSQCIMFFILTKKTFWKSKFWPFFTLQSIICLGLLGITLSNNIYLWASVFLALGVLKSFTYFLSIFHSANDIENRSQKVGIHEAIVGISGSLGPLLGGIFVYYWGLKAPYFLCFVILGIATILEIGIFKFISNKKLKEKIA
ncbi:MAG: MFS transporter [bacterium]